MAFGGFLRQSTAVDVLIGPFLDSLDGDNEETELTIEDEHVLLSKNGQALAAKTNASDAAHDANSMYNCPLGVADVNTCGRLSLIVHISGALFVKMDYQVVTQAVYDELFKIAATGVQGVINPVLSMQDTLDVLLRTILESTVMTVTTIATLTSQISFTLVAGSPDDDAYNDCMILLKSVSTPARKAIGLVSDYGVVDSVKTVTLDVDPGIFTLAVGDEVFIMAVPTKVVDDIKKLIRADKVIDTGETPWVVDYKKEGTEDVLMSKTMKNTGGADVTTKNNVLGQLEQE